VVAGLDAGANDYVTKPFSFEELLARVRVQLRSDDDTEPTTLEHGGLLLDLHTRRAHVDGRTIELTAREFALAEVFMRHPDHVLSRDQLLNLVWGCDHDPGSNVVDVYVRYLRRKHGTDRIATVRGMGYRLGRDRCVARRLADAGRGGHRDVTQAAAAPMVASLRPYVRQVEICLMLLP